MFVAILALIVGTTGFAWAAVKIDTPQIERGAVTAGKIAGGAVRTGKLANGTVTAKKIADGAIETGKVATDARGVALAGVRVGANGVLKSWFNRLGGRPIIERFDPGRYYINIPGDNALAPDEWISSATLRGEPLGEIATDDEITSGGVNLYVTTGDSAGTLQDHAFDYEIYDASSDSG